MRRIQAAASTSASCSSRGLTVLLYANRPRSHRSRIGPDRNTLWRCSAGAVHLRTWGFAIVRSRSMALTFVASFPFSVYEYPPSLVIVR